MTWGHTQSDAVAFSLVGAAAGGGGAISVAWPAGHAAGQQGLLFVASANETVATPLGWTFLAGAGVGAAGTTGVGLFAFSKVSESAAETNAAVADSGGFTLGCILTYANVRVIETALAQASADVNDPTITAPSVTALGLNRIMVTAWASTSNPVAISGYTGAGVAWTERLETGPLGATLSVADAALLAAGPTGIITATTTSSRTVGLSVLLAPHQSYWQSARQA